MSPPQLTRNAPILNVFQPVEPVLLRGLGNNLELATPDGFHRRLSKGLRADPPLGLHNGLDDVVGTTANGEHHLIGHLAAEKSLLFELLFELLPGVVPHHTGERSGILVERTVFVHDVDAGQLVAFAGFKVVEVVGRGDLDGAGTKVTVDHFVGDDRDQAVLERMANRFADEVLVTLVLGVDGNGGISEHRLETGSGHDDLLVGAVHRVSKAGEHTKFVLLAGVVVRSSTQSASIDFDVFDFQVGKSRLERRAPVDKSVLTVDDALVVETNESFLHRVVQVGVHGKLCAVPVERPSKTAELVVDSVAISVGKVIDSVNKNLPKEGE